MKRLSRVKGYTDSQIKRFNEMYAALREDLPEDEEENSNGLLLFSHTEIEQFREYVVLAEADERKRILAMQFKRSVEDFTSDEIAWFDQMQEVLTEFNRLLDDDEIDIKIILPDYSDIEMMEHSQYRELWISYQCRDLE